MRSLIVALSFLFTALAQAERIEIGLTPDEATKKGIRLGVSLQEKRYGKIMYTVGVDTREVSEGKAFKAFSIIIQKPGGKEVELTARMWHQEFPEGVYYTSFDIEESFLPFLFVLIDYGPFRDGLTYRIPVRPYLTRKQSDLPAALLKSMAEAAKEAESN